MNSSSNDHAGKKKAANSNAACPDCASGFEAFTRRDFIRTAGASAVVAGSLGLPRIAAIAADKPAAKPTPETLVKHLFDTLTDEQKKTVAFDWDYADGRGLLRTRVANNWQITKPTIASDFYTKDQQEIIRAMYEGLFNPDWVPKIDKQLQDDGGGYGKSQSIAIFGKPGEGKFELVMTGRHMTVRVSGNSIDHMAFGGPIFHGHAASGDTEKPDHPGNVFWPQAVEANKVFEMLDGKQRKTAIRPYSPDEKAVAFRGPDGKFPGIPVTELSSDQREQLQKAMRTMLDPYRDVDREEVMQCLSKQGGLDRCSLAFYEDEDLGDDGVWDNWRLEGPSFVWYFRGSPHVHLWINIGDSHEVKLNA